MQEWKLTVEKRGKRRQSRLCEVVVEAELEVSHEKVSEAMLVSVCSDG